MRWPAALGAALLCAALATGTPARAEDPAPCPPGSVKPISLPRVRDAMLANNEVTIVALGSSTTQGWRASDIAHTYPALLQHALTAGLPNAHVAVLNRGIGGEDVAEELPRIERDVIGVHPALVIWQVGANGAMRRMEPDLFKRLLTSGVKRLQQAKIDVVLMDNQRAPAILASPEHVQIEQSMAEVATMLGAGLFPRGALMEQWRDAGYPFSRFVADDGVHHNDYGYRCVAAALARSILDGMKVAAVPGNTVTTRR